MPGIETSISTTSGLSFSISWTPSQPVAASPHSSHSGNPSRMFCTPRLTNGWSSTINTRDICEAPWEEGERPDDLLNLARSKWTLNWLGFTLRRGLRVSFRERSSLYNLILNRISHQFAHRVNFELAHDVGAMCFCGLHADS